MEDKKEFDKKECDKKECDKKELKKHKKNIPKALRQQVWLKYNGKCFENKCNIIWCKNNIDVFNFHVGHNIPESKGGKMYIENLRPICSFCNQSMGNINWDDWVFNKMVKEIIEDHFDDPNLLIKCKNKNCKTKIGINNFKPYIFKSSNKAKPLCAECYESCD